MTAADRRAADRRAVIDAFKELPPGAEVTAKMIANRMKCTSKSVVTSIGWLLKGGQLRQTGVVKKRDVMGRGYAVKYYTWTGIDKVYHVPRDPDDQKRAVLRMRVDTDAYMQFLYPARP